MKYLSMGLKLEMNFLANNLKSRIYDLLKYHIEDDSEHNIDYHETRLLVKTSSRGYTFGYIDIIYSQETGFSLKFQKQMSLDVKLAIDDTFEKLLYQYSRGRWCDRKSDEYILIVPSQES